jgi:hypothetical protein
MADNKHVTILNNDNVQTLTVAVDYKALHSELIDYLMVVHKHKYVMCPEGESKEGGEIRRLEGNGFLKCILEINEYKK